MIFITPSIVLDPADLRWSFMRASGPGGQNVNKVSTAVEVRFNVNSAALPDDMRARLATLAGRQLLQSGDLVISSQQYRSQERNREDALQKLITLIRKAAVRPRKRIATRATKASKLRRLESKSRRSDVKSKRRVKPGLDD